MAGVDRGENVRCKAAGGSQGSVRQPLVHRPGRFAQNIAETSQCTACIENLDAQARWAARPGYYKTDTLERASSQSPASREAMKRDNDLMAAQLCRSNGVAEGACCVCGGLSIGHHDQFARQYFLFDVALVALENCHEFCVCN